MPAPQNIFDGLRAVRVCGHFQTQPVCFINDGLHFFNGVLRGAWRITFAQHAA